MNNFEKWKQKLTLKECRKVFFDPCHGINCPAFKVCIETKGCYNALKIWAKQEVNDD